MIKMEVNKDSVNLTIKGSGPEVLTELVIGTLAMLKRMSMDEDMYIDLWDAFIKTIESVTHGEIEEGLEV